MKIFPLHSHVRAHQIYIHVHVHVHVHVHIQSFFDQLNAQHSLFNAHLKLFAPFFLSFFRQMRVKLNVYMFIYEIENAGVGNGAHKRTRQKGSLHSWKW